MASSASSGNEALTSLDVNKLVIQGLENILLTIKGAKTFSMASRRASEVEERALEATERTTEGTGRASKAFWRASEKGRRASATGR